MVRYLINTARPLIFSTAPPPPAVAGALAALELLQERPHRVQRLRSNARALRCALAGEGFPVAEREMHIVPLIVGEERDAMRLCQEALERGVFAQAIRPPTVPDGTSRLRLTVMASHTDSDLRMAASVLGAAARKLGLDPATMAPPTLEREGAHEHPAAEQAADEREESYAAPSIAAAGESGSGVPFDIERDTTITRAAERAERERARPVRNRYGHGRRQGRPERRVARRAGKEGRGGPRVQARRDRARGPGGNRGAGGLATRPRAAGDARRNGA